MSHCAPYPRWGTVLNMVRVDYDGNVISERIANALSIMLASMADLARATGRSHGAVRGWMQGRRMSPQTLEMVAEGLNALAEQRGLDLRWSVAPLLGQGPEAPAPAADDPLAQAVLPSPTLGRPIRPTIVTAPVYGEVPCGEPVRLEGDPEMIDLFDVQLPVGWTSRCILLRARGDSMAAWGIHDGDWLGVDPQAEWRTGDVVIAPVNDQTTCKRLRKAAGGWLLEGSDGAPPIVVQPRDEAAVTGVVIGVVGRPRRLDQLGVM